jgi:hypothetical protein
MGKFNIWELLAPRKHCINTKAAHIVHGCFVVNEFDVKNVIYLVNVEK